HLQRSRNASRRLALPVEVERLAPTVDGKVGARRREAVEQSGHLGGPLVEAASLAAGGGQDALGELIIRQVLLQPRSYPRLKARRIGFKGNAVGVDAKVAGLEQVAKLQRPQRRVARPFQKFVDLLCPLLGGFVGEEGADF